MADEMSGRCGTADITKMTESTFWSVKCTEEDDYAIGQDVLQLDGDDICTEEDDYAIGQALKLEGYDIGPNEIYIGGDTAQNFQDISIENRRIGEMSVLLDGVYVNRSPFENSNPRSTEYLENKKIK